MGRLQLRSSAVGNIDDFDAVLDLGRFTAGLISVNTNITLVLLPVQFEPVVVRAHATGQNDGAKCQNQLSHLESSP